MNLLNKKQHQKDYDDGLCGDCPYCGADRPEHACSNCCDDIEKEVCWKYGGYCKKCFIYVHEELPKIRGLKQELGVVCQCDDPQCAKCLSVNCVDENCPTHTKDLKLNFQLRNR